MQRPGGARALRVLCIPDLGYLQYLSTCISPSMYLSRVIIRLNYVPAGSRSSLIDESGFDGAVNSVGISARTSESDYHHKRLFQKKF